MSELLCGKHNRQKECIGGASAHISNWYCPDCYAEIDEARKAAIRIANRHDNCLRSMTDGARCQCGDHDV